MMSFVPVHQARPSNMFHRSSTLYQAEQSRAGSGRSLACICLETFLGVNGLLRLGQEADRYILENQIWVALNEIHVGICNICWPTFNSSCVRRDREQLEFFKLLGFVCYAIHFLCLQTGVAFLWSTIISFTFFLKTHNLCQLANHTSVQIWQPTTISFLSGN